MNALDIDHAKSVNGDDGGSYAGALTWTGLHSFMAGLELGNEISPAELGTTQDDWNPTGLATASVIRVIPHASGTLLSGIVAQGARRIIVVINTRADRTLTLKHDATSTAANRINCPSAGNLALGVLGCAVLWYDTTVDRWIVIAKN